MELVDYYYARKPSPLRLEEGRACFIDARCIVIHPQRTALPPAPAGEGATGATPGAAAASTAAAATVAVAAADEEAVVGGGGVPAAAPFIAAADHSQELAPQASTAVVPSHVARPSLTEEEEEGSGEGSAGAGGSGAPAPAAAAEAEAEGESEAESGVGLP